MDDTWEAKEITKHMGRVVNNETETVYGNFRLSSLATDKSNDELFDDVANAYVDYHKKERKQRILHAEIRPDRMLVIREKGSGTELAGYKMKKNEDIVKDFKFVSTMLNSHEKYIKSML